MLDGRLRPFIDLALEKPAEFLVAKGINADQVTVAGFISTLIAMGFIAFGFYGFGLFFLLSSRILDGLDGAVARKTRLTDFGGYLDIVFDMIFYAGIVFAFAFSRPDDAVYAAFLIFAFMSTGTSFLAYAVLAAKRGQETQNRGQKSFYYIGGLCEGTETITALSLICLLPNLFPFIAFVYGILCLMTTLARVFEARAAF